ncbi:unnamed protein product [Spirodela intermedia]|uniref:1-phosphatidylinositol-3-phosphate 5-kinase n=1 Tax=Spirodela intermedia TaxID=51605 RepID=A0A7I8J3B7_SPIIN|nr:unnamed protein product [Spirodela intermedia]CAA6663840.1 unnamed protein product [Spirodela intermedia]
MGDDLELSVANNDDDDDEYYGGTKWSQPSSLGSSDEGIGINNNYKEERQKAMMEAMNGQFKSLVARFLASEGIPLSTEELGESWLDIISSISWEAAMLVRPDVNEGKAMDPGSYVKVKCIACGSPVKVIKGLVFKKNAAHKHMPTKLTNPRLLLLRGVLGQHAAGLSSFSSMEQVDDQRMQPNVVLVEKTVSRDIQESLLKKGITLVFDMKLHRLERIARCTGSPILSPSGVPVYSQLRQCDSFHIEKFVPSKTLMFLEGCPKPLGCTILLKGAHSDELKRLKRVVHYTVFAAYHLILETSFFADQRAVVTNAQNCEGFCSSNESPSVINFDTSSNSASHNQEFIAPSAAGVDIPISDESLNKSSRVRDFVSMRVDDEPTSGIYDFSRLDSDLMPRENGIAPGGLSDGQIGVTENCQEEEPYDPPTSSLPPGQFISLSSVSDSKGEDPLILTDSISDGSDSSSISSKVKDVDTQSGEVLHVSLSSETLDAEIKPKVGTDLVDSDDGTPAYRKMEQGLHIGVDCNAVNGRHKLPDDNNTGSVFDSKSILPPFRIKYYGNFDVSLGRFLQDILLNQKHSCSVCNEPSEVHTYSYTHQNGRLTALVQRLPPESRLSGEVEGKIWMWTRCLKCEHKSGIPEPTRRVVMSNAAHGLSFGKFLELSFSSHSASRRISRCGHSLQRDCLKFFGLGPLVAMFTYSPVDIYAACEPPPVVEFNTLNGDDWLKTEARNALRKVELLFSEVGRMLEKIKPDFLRQNKKYPGPLKEFRQVEEMWRQEKSELEDPLMKIMSSDGQPAESVHDMLDFPFLEWELLLELYAWDRRIDALLSSGHDAMPNERLEEADGVVGDRPAVESSESPDNGHLDGGFSGTEMEETTNANGAGADQSSGLDGSPDAAVTSDSPDLGYSVLDVPSIEPPLPDDEEDLPSGAASHPAQENGAYSPSEDPRDDEVVNVDVSDQSEKSEKPEIQWGQDPSQTRRRLRDPDTWIWDASGIRKAYRQELSRGGHSQRFDFVRHYSPLHLSSVDHLVKQDREWVHFPVGVDGNVMSICEDEISSLIAYALASSQDQQSSDEREPRSSPPESFHSGLRSEASFYLPSFNSLDLEGLRSTGSFSSFSSEETTASAPELAGDYIPPGILHPEIVVGECSVYCVHARQFHALRRRCCPSEAAYLSSIRRKAFFAKTLDDRFIIKQIKKRELESFLRFAPEYFKHISHSLSTGNQTCLAKILGIYRVKQVTNGKELKIDLMVMENLLYGREISRVYDLKGAVFSRYVSDASKPNAVLLDQNFVEDMGSSPLFLAGKTKHLFQRAIWNDTSFLTSINVMDYSLLVGVDKQKQELVFGIIDYLRQYTWDKQLETWVKSSLVVPKNTSPTVISPKDYKKRFRKFMSKHFLTVPDDSVAEPCSQSCRPCAAGEGLRTLSEASPPPQTAAAAAAAG